MQPPPSLCEAEEGETSETQPKNHQLQSSEATSFLYSIPQWQPPPTQPTGQHPSRKPNPPYPSQRTRPASLTGQQPSQRPIQPVRPRRARPSSVQVHDLLASTLASLRSNKPPSTQLQSPQPPVFRTNLGRDERIPEIWKKDALDGRIGIRPRNKTSTELQQLKSSRLSYGEKGVGLSRAMKIIIQQFMVANGYVSPHQHIPGCDQSASRNSLLVRLDLHNTFKATKETADEQRLIKSTWASIDGYVSEQSREWRAQGVFEQELETAPPIFAAFTRSWTDLDWDGRTRDFTRATRLTTMSPVMPVSPDDNNSGSRPTYSKASREAKREVTVLDIDTEGSLEKSYDGLEPTLKRPGHHGLNTEANKRTRTGDYAPITSEHEYVDHFYDQENGLGFTSPEEKGLQTVIEAIHHARATMLELAPMSAKDLAVTQQDWASHGFPSMLAETLTMGRAYTTTMGNYFDNTLDLLSLLKESGHWKTGHAKVQVDCGCQKEGAGPAPEQSHNGMVLDPPIPCQGEVKVQSFFEREDAIPDRSQDGKLSDRPIPPAGDIKVDRSSQPEDAAPNPLQKGECVWAVASHDGKCSTRWSL